MSGRHRYGSGFLALLVALGVSHLGEAMVLIGLPWFVLDTGGDIVDVGVVATAGTAGSALCGMLGGPLVDRIGLRRTAIVALSVGGAAMGAILLAHRAGVLTFPLLIVLTVAATALDGPGGIAMTGLAGAVARARGAPLESVNAILQGVGHLAFLVGPALGALIATLAGPAVLLLMDGLGCGLAAVVLLAGMPRPVAVAPAPAGAYLSRLREGIAVLRADPLVRVLVPYSVVLDALGAALVSIVLVAYSHQVLGAASGLGAMVSAFSVGALIGALGYGALAARIPRRAAFFAGHVLTVVLLALMALTPPFPVLLAAIFVAGVLGAPVEAVGLAVLQERVVPTAFGRVGGARAAMTAVAAPCAIAVVSFAVAGAGLSVALAGMALFALLLVVAGLLHPGLRRLSGRAGVGDESMLSQNMTGHNIQAQEAAGIPGRDHGSARRGQSMMGETTWHAPGTAGLHRSSGFPDGSS